MIVLDMTVRDERDTEPILTVRLRREQLPDETLDQFCERLTREACRQLHQPKQEWRLA